MQFLNRLFGLDSNVSRPRHEGGSRRRNQVQFSLDRLEDRDLKSGAIPGVYAQYGVINISATQGSGNSASVSIDQSNQMVKVTLNGNSVEYSQSDVYSVNYMGGTNGSDTFRNDTSLTSLIYAYGGNNNITGSSSYNVAFIYGDNNTYSDQADTTSNLVFCYNGPNDAVLASNNVQLYSYNYNMATFW